MPVRTRTPRQPKAESPRRVLRARPAHHSPPGGAHRRPPKLLGYLDTGATDDDLPAKLVKALGVDLAGVRAASIGGQVVSTRSSCRATGAWCSTGSWHRSSPLSPRRCAADRARLPARVRRHVRHPRRHVHVAAARGHSSARPGERLISTSRSPDADAQADCLRPPRLVDGYLRRGPRSDSRFRRRAARRRDAPGAARRLRDYGRRKRSRCRGASNVPGPAAEALCVATPREAIPLATRDGRAAP